ncbi:hypothetical protein O2313_04990 [Bacillus amyloliquefaciens]|uniref:hypothetical protein n=1 Tax=Bacillus amyloliquefaciens TaxID=1390 RepID=UPI0022AE91C9|nr:hypothetical protein [Bacillus amyloliquefaciens]MCZ4246886.1 hypothetical protein [Bacillus amyloliquefaciens]
MSHHEEDLLYISQMEGWITEHGLLEKQLERVISYHRELSDNHKKISDLNEIQLKAHRKSVEIVKSEYSEWLKEHGSDKK